MSENHGLDTDTQVFFYEQDFYVLSNFSAFKVFWKSSWFDTSEHVYHWEKFTDKTTDCWNIRREIFHAKSAHMAFKTAQSHASHVRKDWHDVRVSIMKEILLAKTNEHEYVRCKLLATGNRELIENSWMDNFWGLGEDRKGQNMLGKLWMEIREELRK